MIMVKGNPIQHKKVSSHSVNRSGTKTRKKRTTTGSRRKYTRHIHHASFFSPYNFLHIPFIRKNKIAWLIGAIGIMILYIWAFYHFFVGPTGFRWRALYSDADYPQGYEIEGIDISHYQGDIDWEELRNAMINGCPVRFIIVKSTEGSSQIDSKFYSNFRNAREYGFIRGAYHYWSIKSSARQQAYYFLEKVKLTEGDLPPVLDVEHKPSQQSTEDFQRDVLTWLHIVEDRYHVKPIIYTYYKFKDRYLNAPVFDDYPYWIAHYYVKKVEYKGNWKFWQHTDAGKLSGIKGYIDFNIYNGSYYDLRKLTIGSQQDVFDDND